MDDVLSILVIIHSQGDYPCGDSDTPSLILVVSGPAASYAQHSLCFVAPAHNHQ